MDSFEDIPQNFLSYAKTITGLSYVETSFFGPILIWSLLSNYIDYMHSPYCAMFLLKVAT